MQQNTMHGADGLSDRTQKRCMCRAVPYNTGPSGLPSGGLGRAATQGCARGALPVGRLGGYRILPAWVSVQAQSSARRKQQPGGYRPWPYRSIGSWPSCIAFLSLSLYIQASPSVCIGLDSLGVVRLRLVYIYLPYPRCTPTPAPSFLRWLASSLPRSLAALQHVEPPSHSFAVPLGSHSSSSPSSHRNTPTTMRAALLTWALGLLATTQALPQITRTGKYLYDPSGNRFYIKVSPCHHLPYCSEPSLTWRSLDQADD